MVNENQTFPLDSLPKTGKKHIYKTVKVITDNGLGTELNFGYQIKQFKCKNGCEHHNHLVCIVCGGISYLDSEKLEDLQDGIAKDQGFKPQKHNFQILGMCNNCQ